MDVIKNCIITQSDAKILKKFCIDVSDPLYKQYGKFNTYVSLSCSDVYSMYSGKVVMLNQYNRYSVVILLNSSQAIRYGNLKSVDVKLNQSIDISQRIGIADKCVYIEYFTTRIKNNFPFRLNNILMYKDDPMNILDSSNIIYNSIQYSESGLQSIMDSYDGGIDIESELILSNNKGE